MKATFGLLAGEVGKSRLFGIDYLLGNNMAAENIWRTLLLLWTGIYGRAMHDTSLQGVGVYVS